MVKCKNLFYISNFNHIGGVETFIYELGRKYQDYDIVVVYKTGDQKQINRLKQYVRVIRFKNQIFQCEKAFFNYGTDIIKNIQANEYIQIIHAAFKSQGIKPIINPKITKYLCVSSHAGKEWEELTGFKPILCKNPLTFTEQEKTPALLLLSATRLTKEKGKERMIKLGELLNQAKINYIWFVFTNDTNEIKNPNIIFLPPRLDIKSILATIKGKGYGVQLSDTEGDCYFTRECEALGVPVIATPLPSLKEQGLVDGKNCYFIPFDVQNIDIQKIVNNIPEYEPFQNEDIWDKILEPGESQYKKDFNIFVKVKPIKKYFDLELNKEILPSDKSYLVNKVRASILVEAGICKIIE